MINVIVGSKRFCILLLFIPIIGLKSFKSIVVLFAPSRHKKWFYHK